MTKKLKLLILLLIVFLAGLGIFFNQQKSPPTINNEAVQNKSTLIIDYGNGKIESTPFTPRPEQTAFDVLKEISQEKGILLDTKQYDFGIFVKAIGGYESGSDMAWIYYINGASGTVAADKQVIKTGDLVEWRYVAPSEE